MGKAEERDRMAEPGFRQENVRITVGGDDVSADRFLLRYGYCNL